MEWNALFYFIYSQIYLYNVYINLLIDFNNSNEKKVLEFNNTINIIIYKNKERLLTKNQISIN